MYKDTENKMNNMHIFKGTIDLCLKMIQQLQSSKQARLVGLVEDCSTGGNYVLMYRNSKELHVK